MLRFVALSLFALVLVPSAVAEGVAVGPDGLADPRRGDHYYVWVVPSMPEAPRAADATRDCAAGARPDAATSAFTMVGGLRAWDPMSDFGAGSWAPTCLSATTPACPAAGMSCPVPVPSAHASYDVGAGRYYLEASGAPIPAGHAAQTTAFSGTTGAGLFFDCVGCPPPVCCVN